jgi:hypothetical protein
VATILSAIFVWALALAVSPQLHERIHHDTTAEHVCAATLIASGNYVHSTTPPPLVRPEQLQQFGEPKLAASEFVASAFLIGAVLEHAPPLPA